MVIDERYKVIEERNRTKIFLILGNKIPFQFSIICRYLFPINFRQENRKKINDFNEEIEALDFLLWKWKNPLSREWYQYLLILKHNLQLVNGSMEMKRIEKVFPVPLKDTLLRLKLEDK